MRRSLAPLRNAPFKMTQPYKKPNCIHDPKVIRHRMFIQARAIVTPQVKPIPDDANINNCPG